MLWSRAEASAGELRVRRGMISHRLDVSCGTTPRPVGRKGGSMPHRWPGAAGSSSTRCSRRIARRAGYVLRAAPLWRRRCRCRDAVRTGFVRGWSGSCRSPSSSWNPPYGLVAGSNAQRMIKKAQNSCRQPPGCAERACRASSSPRLRQASKRVGNRSSGQRACPPACDMSRPPGGAQETASAGRANSRARARTPDAALPR
jgi:hypothetical protein